jgi:hypothetical protein
MSQSAKKKKQQRKIQQRNQTKLEPPNQKVLDLIGSPNVWTPEVEDVWLAELGKIPGGEIYSRFPPMKKPPSVRNRAAGSGWGDSDA